jgi:hypothetical protein
MTSPLANPMPDPFSDPLLPIPEGAVLLPEDHPPGTARELAIAALRQALAERQLHALPMGPSQVAEESDRLLLLNHFAIQLVCTGLFHSEVSVDTGAWLEEATAPQLLLAAAVDLDDLVVVFPGVLTATEFVTLAGAEKPTKEGKIALPLARFHGGLERLLTAVELMELDAIPRRALPPALAARPGVSINAGVVAVLDWLRGRIDDTLTALGGELQPVNAGAFRSGDSPPAAGPLAGVVVLPVTFDGQALRLGRADNKVQEALRLEVLATGTAPACCLRFRLLGDPPGALLPDGLRLAASTADQTLCAISLTSTRLELAFPPTEQPVELAISLGDQPPLKLPKPFLLAPDAFP